MYKMKEKSLLKIMKCCGIALSATGEFAIRNRGIRDLQPRNNGVKR